MVSGATNLLWPWLHGAHSQIQTEHSCLKHNSTRAVVAKYREISLRKSPVPPSEPAAAALLLWVFRLSSLVGLGSLGEALGALAGQW